MSRTTANATCPVYGLLDNIRSAWNVGAMFRTADGAGLSGLYLCGMTATPPRPDIEKTALGASRTVPWDYWPRTEEALAELRRRRVHLVALETTPGAQLFDTARIDYPVCFAVGHEVHGIRPEVLALCDQALAIPMHGTKESLNVAVSFGIMAYSLRQRWEAQNAPANRCE